MKRSLSVFGVLLLVGTAVHAQTYPDVPTGHWAYDAITELTNLDIRPVTELLPDGAALEQPWLYAKAIGCALQA